MINRIKIVLESLGVLDIIDRYSKTTPQFKLDDLKKSMNKRGYDFRVIKETDDSYTIDIKPLNKEVVLSKKDLLNDEISFHDLINVD